MDFILSQDRRWSNLFTAISINFPVIPVIHFNWLQKPIFLFNHFLKKISKNGSDTPTSNRRPSIFTSSAIGNFPLIKLQFRSIWRWWTRETPWIWRREYSRHRDREFIFSPSRDWRNSHLHHHHSMFILILFFIWTGVESGWVMLKRQTTSLINSVRWPSNRRWTWNRAIKFGWPVNSQQRQICMTTLTTWLISRVSCCRRK